MASKLTKFVATEARTSVETEKSWTLTWYNAMRALSTDQRPYTIKRSHQVLHVFNSSFATASAQHFDIVTKDLDVLLVSSWWSMPRSRSLVLRISNNCRGTRFRMLEISVRYIETELRSSCIWKNRKIDVFLKDDFARNSIFGQLLCWYDNFTVGCYQKSWILWNK
jgi:hypothetical protein